MDDPREVVGTHFEKLVKNIFNLLEPDSREYGLMPDLTSREGSFDVEVKASSYTNGGVINEKQLMGFNNFNEVKRFYAFAYHSITKNMKKKYPTADKLKDALELKSLYLFPLSIVKAHFETSKKRKPKNHDAFVSLKEKHAKEIFELEKGIWNRLKLNQDDYNLVQPHDNVYIVTKFKFAEEEILNSFNFKHL